MKWWFIQKIATFGNGKWKGNREDLSICSKAHKNSNCKREKENIVICQYAAWEFFPKELKIEGWWKWDPVSLGLCGNEPYSSGYPWIYSRDNLLLTCSNSIRTWVYISPCWILNYFREKADHFEECVFLYSPWQAQYSCMKEKQNSKGSHLKKKRMNKL